MRRIFGVHGAWPTGNDNRSVALLFELLGRSIQRQKFGFNFQFTDFPIDNLDGEDVLNILVRDCTMTKLRLTFPYCAPASRMTNRSLCAPPFSVGPVDLFSVFISWSLQHWGSKREETVLLDENCWIRFLLIEDDGDKLSSSAQWNWC